MTLLFDLSACGKLPVVTVSLAIIFIGVWLYALRLGRTLRRLEAEVEQLSNNESEEK